MKRHFLVFSLCVFAVAGMPVPGLCDYQVTCIDPNGKNPDINSQGHVVWEAVDPSGSDMEIFLFDGNSTTQVTTNDTPDDSARINDSGEIAWLGTGTLFPARDQIHFFNGTTIEKLTDDTWGKRKPEINNQGKITWDAVNLDGDPGGVDHEVYLYDGTVKRLTDNTSGQDDLEPRINDSGQVVWYGHVGSSSSDYEIFLYDNGVTQQLTDDGAYQDGPNINNSGHMVWWGYDPGSGGYDIFFRDTVITNLTSDSVFDYDPQINDLGHVVWMRKNNVGGEDLYRFDGSSITPLTVDSSIHSFWISNGYVAWAAVDGVLEDMDIFVFDGTTTTQLTNDDRGDFWPRVNDSGTVVWQSQSNGICLAEIVVPPPPPAPAIYYPATGVVDIPEVVIAGSAKAYSVLLQRLGVPGYMFQLGKAKKMTSTGNAVASFDPVTGILEIAILAIDGKTQKWWIQLVRQAGDGYVFKLLKARKN